MGLVIFDEAQRFVVSKAKESRSFCGRWLSSGKLHALNDIVIL